MESRALREYCGLGSSRLLSSSTPKSYFKPHTDLSIVALLITSYKNIGDFQTVMQGGTGVHSAAHFTIGSDPGGDFYTSPGDPAFWLLHGQIDRVWTIWQVSS
jgi:hypothetical protein